MKHKCSIVANEPRAYRREIRWIASSQDRKDFTRSSEFTCGKVSVMRCPLPYDDGCLQMKVGKFSWLSARYAQLGKESKFIIKN